MLILHFEQLKTDSDFLVQKFGIGEQKLLQLVLLLSLDVPKFFVFLLEDFVFLFVLHRVKFLLLKLLFEFLNRVLNFLLEVLFLLTLSCLKLLLKVSYLVEYLLIMTLSLGHFTLDLLSQPFQLLLTCLQELLIMLHLSLH